MINRIAVALIIILSANIGYAQRKQLWVDSVFNTMSIDQQIGQLLFIKVSASADDNTKTDIAAHIKEAGIGGLVFAEINNVGQATLINQFQTISRVPLLIGADTKNSVGPFLDSTVTFPPASLMGAIANDSTVSFAGFEIARQLRLMGVQFSFLPANISDPDIVSPDYSFGESRTLVTRKALAFWKGLRAGGLTACARYFPIQGLTITEIQKGVPTVQLTVDSLDSYVFNELFRSGVPALMPASRDLPMFYPQKKAALKNIFSSSSLSTAFAADWVRKNMQYDGLFMIDVQNMKGGSKKFAPGEAEVFAFRAGNDVLITNGDINASVRRFKRMFRKEKNWSSELERSVKKILALKYDARLHRKPGELIRNANAVVTTQAKLLRRRIYEQVPAVVRNTTNLIPVQSLENKHFVCVIADDPQANDFTHMLSKYVQVSVIKVDGKTERLSLQDTLPRQQTIIIGFFPKTTESTITKIKTALSEERINREVIVCDFGSPAFRAVAGDFSNVISGFSNEKIIQQLVPQILFGALPANGMIPYSMGSISAGQHLKTGTLDRLGYSFPEDVGMDSRVLNNIDAVAKEAIEIGATPGCNVLIAKDGKVVFEKSYGYLTYEKQTPVTDQTIYDLASVTKVSATLQTTMFMYDKNLIDINKKAAVYLPELKTTNKKDFVIKDILTHQAGLRPFIPFYVQTMKDSTHLPEYYSSTPSADYPFVVADRLFSTKAMRDSIWTWILRGKLQDKIDRTPYEYVYSDMSFYMLQHLAEKILNQPLEDFVHQNLYEPLGAYTTGFLPLLRFPISQIAPTENDKIFRKSLLIGTVHDPGAAMHGGVAGHAGLFSTANDLAKLYQMLLQGGTYGGVRYYKPETVKLFSQKQFESSRRGLGWDKPSGDWKASTGLFASPKTFGHTGYTGTCVWADPEFNALYIFLSNRVHPVVTNKLLNANIRSRIQDIMYQSIFEYCKSGGQKPEVSTQNSTQIFGGSQ